MPADTSGPAGAGLDLRAVYSNSHGCLGLGAVTMAVGAAACTGWGIAISDVSLLVFAGALAAPALGLGVMLAWFYPTTRARQSVTVDDEGLLMSQERKLWLPARTLRLSWSRVRAVRLRSDSPFLRFVDIELDELPERDSAPGFAKLVPAGRRPPGRGPARDRPRVRVRMPPGIHYDLIGPIRSIRPDLLQATEPSASHAAGDGAGSGAADRSAAPEPARRSIIGVPAAGPQWVSFRAQGAPGLIGVAFLALVGLAGVVIQAAEAYRNSWDVGLARMIPGTAGALLVAVAASWGALRMAPVRTTRQGVAVDATGVTLRQEPRWWFPGRSTHIPWPQILLIRDEKRREDYVSYRAIDLMLDGPDLAPQVPSWVERNPRELTLPPATDLRPLTRITIRKWRQERVLQALCAVRPELCP